MEQSFNNLFYSYYRYIHFKEENHHRNYLKVNAMMNLALENNDYPLRDKILGFYYYTKKRNLNIPNYLHLCITDYCQLKCKHCYFGDYERKYTMTPENVRTIIDKFFGIREYISSKSNTILEQTITANLAGGEPLAHPDILSIIDSIPENKFNILKILSNGISYNKEAITKIIPKCDSFVYQISLDGLRENHDFVRGNGTYNKSIKTLNQLRKDFPNLYIQVAFNAHHNNYKDVFELSKIVKDLGCNKIFFDRYVPYWKSELKMMTQNEYNYYNDSINKTFEELNDENFLVFRNRSMQFDNNYKCGAGIRHQIAKADGTRIACTRYHLETGNWYTDDIKTLVENAIRAEIQTQQIPLTCISCEKVDKCVGGMRCLSYICDNKFDTRDKHCLM